MAVSIHTKRVTKPFMASVADIRTYVYGATYDSWNRVQTMTYPDGEVVTYHYNAAGQVESLTSNKQGRQSVIVDRIGYDKEGHTVYTKLGNGLGLEDIKFNLIWIQIVERNYIGGLRDFHFLTIFIQIVI